MGNRTVLPDCFGWSKEESAEMAESQEKNLFLAATSDDSVAAADISVVDTSSSAWSLYNVVHESQTHLTKYNNNLQAWLSSNNSNSNNSTPPVPQGVDWRAFVLLVHPTYGALLLHCTRKKNKPPHYQLPGGHVDDEEFDQYRHLLQQQQQPQSPASSNNMSAWMQLYYAARAGAARELWEETGMDFRGEEQLDRLMPLILCSTENNNSNNNNEAGTKDDDDKKDQVSKKKTKKSQVIAIPDTPLPNVYKQRIFFVAQITNEDFLQPPSTTDNKSPSPRLTRPDIPENNDNGDDEMEETEEYIQWRQQQRQLMLRLSVEHAGFIFEKDPKQCVERLKWHSGGKVSLVLSTALTNSQNQEKEESLLNKEQQQRLDEEEAMQDILEEFGASMD